MLGKLMKYEFKASGRILMPIYIAVLALGLLSGIFMRFTTGNYDNLTFVQFIGVLLIVLYVFLIFADLILSFVISIIRFKKNLFESEGYLMNTLPVKTSDNILAKTFVATIYQIVGAIIAGISGILFALVNIKFINISFADFSQVMYELQQILANYGIPVTLYSIESILIGIFGMFSANLMVYAAIAIGHSANTKKVFKSVGAYIGLYIVSQIINLNIIKLVSFINIFGDMDISRNVYAAQPAFIGLILFEMVYSVAYFAITNYFLKNKLNLQ